MKKVYLSMVCAVMFAALLGVVGASAQVTLPVEFKAQVPPGTWSGTANCGQASINMVLSYHQGVTPTAQGIMAIDDYLARSKWDRPINRYNGSGTTPLMLLDVAIYYGGFPESYMATQWTLAEIKESLDFGLPVVCRVTAKYLTNRGYPYTGAHVIVAVGYDDGAIICHDPGTPYGAFKRYSNYDFQRAHRYGGSNDWIPGTVVVVIPGDTPPVIPPAGEDEDPPPVIPPIPPQTFLITVEGNTWSVPYSMHDYVVEWLDDYGTVVE